jgi:aspartate/methionine/tyrosine aminotransferase
MYRAPRYLEWARRHYGKVPFDLASSGLTPATRADTGEPPRLEEPDAPARLRTAIAAFNGVPETEAIPALGTTHALWLAYASLVEAGDEVLVESPGYEPVWSLAEGAGARVLRFSRRPEDRYAIDIDALLARVTPKTKIVAITSPHNPSGIRVADEALARLAAGVAARGAYLLVDEVYAPLGRMAPGARVWGRSARRLSERVIAVSSLTKSFGLGDARIGWVLAPTEVIARAESVLLSTCGSLPTQHAAFGAWAFTRLDALAARADELTRGKRETVDTWMARRANLTWSAPAGGLFGFAVSRAPGDLLPAIERGADELGVLVAAGTFFGVPNGFRLSWTIGREKLDEALARLGRVLDDKASWSTVSRGSKVD